VIRIMSEDHELSEPSLPKAATRRTLSLRNNWQRIFLAVPSESASSSSEHNQVADTYSGGSLGV